MLDLLASFAPAISNLQLLAQAAEPSTAAASGGLDPKFWAYAGFILLVLIFLALDLGVFHRHAHVVKFKEAMTWSVIWVTTGVLFSGFVYLAYENHWLGLGIDTPKYATPAEIEAAASAEGGDAKPGQSLIIRGEVRGFEAAKQYLVGYVVEKSLAMDNIFVIAMLFGFFAVPAKYQHRVLFWGIIGALIMRGAMIGLGAAAILKYQWVLIIFGVFLLLTSLKMALINSESDPSKNPVVRIVRKFYPVTDFYDGQRFFTKRTLAPTYSEDPATGETRQDPPPAGTLRASYALTPLFLALIMVEITDLIFAVDSIPAIFGITPDPFIVFTSNIFAILGLRSLYFCLAALIMKFRYLKPALILILSFVGVKLLLLSMPPYLPHLFNWMGFEFDASKPIKIDTTISLLVVLGLLGGAIVASVLHPAKPEEGEGVLPPTP